MIFCFLLFILFTYSCGPREIYDYSSSIDTGIIFKSSISYNNSLSNYEVNSSQSSYNNTNYDITNITNEINPLDIIISEINWAGISQYSDGEFVEIFNTLDVYVNLSGFKIIYTNYDGNTTRTYIIPQGIIIEPKGFFVIFIKSAYNQYYKLEKIKYTVWTDQTSIYNTGFSFTLLDKNDNIIDFLDARGSATGGFTPKGSSSTTLKKSMERRIPISYGNSVLEWSAAIASRNISEVFSPSNYATPGTNNSIWTNDIIIISSSSSSVQSSSISSSSVSLSSESYSSFYSSLSNASGSILISNSFEYSDGFTNFGNTDWEWMAKDGLWIGKSVYIYSTGKISGSLGAGFNEKDDYLRTPFVFNPGILMFKGRSSGTNAVFTISISYIDQNNLIIEETNLFANKMDGNITTNAKTYEILLDLDGWYQIEWNMSARGASGSFYLDDIIIIAK